MSLGRYARSLGLAPPAARSYIKPDRTAHPPRRFPLHIPALLAPTASRLLGGVNVMHSAVVGRHSALDAFQAHCSSAVTLLATCYALLVCPLGYSRRAEPAACFMHARHLHSLEP